MKQDNGKINVVSAGKPFTMRSLMINVLDALNLPFDKGEADNEIFVQYQGEWFRILFLAEESHYVEIQDNYWYSAPLDDIENLSITHKAINRYNINGSYRMCYSYHKNSNSVAVHTLHEVLWLPQIPELGKYLLSIFNGILRSHQVFFNNMEDIRREEYNENNNF